MTIKVFESTRRLVINLSFLKENILNLQKDFPDKKIIFMVKANAYGHGDIPIIEYAFKKCNITQFGVASIKEANRIREQLPYLEFDLFVFSDLNLENEFESYLDKNIIPVIGSIKQLEFFLSNKNHFIPISLKFNTGMNRIGIDFDHDNKVIEILKKNNINKISYLMSHYASSYLKIDENNIIYDQYKRFESIKDNFINSGIRIENTSIDNSGSIEQKFNNHHNVLRPGLMLYGPSCLMNAKKRDQLKSKMLSSLKGSILKIFEVKKGQTFGYSNNLVKNDGTMLLINLGYADGLPMEIIGSKIMIKDNLCEFVGRLNMDMAFIQINKSINEINLSVGDEISLWGENPNQFYQVLGTKLSAYDVLCSMNSHRINFEYIE